MVFIEESHKARDTGICSKIQREFAICMLTIFMASLVSP